MIDYFYCQVRYVCFNISDYIASSIQFFHKLINMVIARQRKSIIKPRKLV